MKKMTFPSDFIWGTATSGHQVEGNNSNSDWWFLEQQGQPHFDVKSGRAVDYWNRYEEDHRLMKELGYPAFRLGLEWSRIEPAPGQYDSEALEHYRRILQSLKDNGISICLTLYHWVLPQWVAESGGWCNPATLKHFEAFAERVVGELIEYPDLWITVNEPAMPAAAGHLLGEHPPFKRRFGDYRKTALALLRAHTSAYHLIHRTASAKGLPRPRVGIANAYPLFEPWGSSGWRGWYEKAAAGTLTHFAYRGWDRAIAEGRRFLWHGMRRIPGVRGSVDYCGINYYFRMSLRFDKTRPRKLFINETGIPGNGARTQMGWQIYPQGLYEIIHRVWHQFRKPIIITENGIADREDAMRPNYLLSHLFRVYEAIREGIPVAGYFHWSFIDNFEWMEGFAPRFGLVEVDARRKELERTPRPSAHLYSAIIRQGGITEELVEEYAPELLDSFHEYLRQRPD